jgi:hypothetical protein
MAQSDGSLADYDVLRELLAHAARGEFGHDARALHQARLWRRNTGVSWRARVPLAADPRRGGARDATRCGDVVQAGAVRSTVMDTNTPTSCRWPALLLNPGGAAGKHATFHNDSTKGASAALNRYRDAAITAHHHLDMRSVQKRMSGQALYLGEEPLAFSGHTKAGWGRACTASELTVFLEAVIALGSAAQVYALHLMVVRCRRPRAPSHCGCAAPASTSALSRYPSLPGPSRARAQSGSECASRESSLRALLPLAQWAWARC